MGSLVETAIFSQWFHSDVMMRLQYARWKSGRQDTEVDMVLLNLADIRPAWAIEIKWSDRWLSHSDDISGLLEFAQKNQIDIAATTRAKEGSGQFGNTELKYLPSALHCYRIGKNLVGQGDALRRL